ncbi:MAG: class I SAM-dependent methyltransferase [Bacteroidota bacterium]
MSDSNSSLVKTANEKEQNQNIQNYYKWQSKIYDATRWTFLFGRKKLVKVLPFEKDAKIDILEIGCGTGYNLKRLAKAYPNASLTGLDVSEDMITLSKKQCSNFSDRIDFLQQPYGPGQNQVGKKYDAILFPYSLTMINPHWKSLIEHAPNDLKDGGVVGVADFHDSNFMWFKKHMSNHHVRMDSHLVPVLEEHFDTIRSEVKSAYGGVWHYVLHIGKKRK